MNRFRTQAYIMICNLKHWAERFVFVHLSDTVSRCITGHSERLMLLHRQQHLKSYSTNVMNMCFVVHLMSKGKHYQSFSFMLSMECAVLSTDM